MDNVYIAIFLIGLLGLVVQTAMGGHLSHHSGHPHFTGHSHAHNPTSVKHASGQARHGSRNITLFLSLLSPLTLFSICIGSGATGLIVNHLHLPTWITITFVAVGGLAFYGFAIRPLISIILNFGSKESVALDGMVAKSAEAASRFDDSGKGLVKVIIDGQIVRLLATLEDSDRKNASKITPGDNLVVTRIDTHRNACHVALV